MNGVRSTYMRKGYLLDCPCRGCAACGVFWDGVGTGQLTIRCSPKPAEDA